ncbi:MAG: class I SAM-dependent methyltransferase [Thermoleophilia bacterium]
MARVEGWLSRHDAELVVAVSEVQRDAGIEGAIGEIGVHHGRLFILLQLLRGARDEGFACDLFGDQQQNVDHSGRGDYNQFMSNVRMFSSRPLTTFSCSSLALEPGDILDAVGRPRLVSIDGGHTSEATVSDLKLVEAVLCEGGVIILDDVFTPYWPGVVSGLSVFLEDAHVRPFLIGLNKVFLSKPVFGARLQERIRTQLPSVPMIESRLFDSEVLLALPRQTQAVVGDATLAKLYHSRIYQGLRQRGFVLTAERRFRRWVVR